MEHTFSEIRAFNAIVRSGNFSRAAGQLNVSQPAITAQIRKLESRFAFPLLERFSKGIQLTEMGKSLYRITRQYEDLDDAIDKLANPNKQPDELTLRVASASTFVFMPLIARFRERYPNINLVLKAATTSECKEMLQNREVELSLCPVLDVAKGVSKLTFHEHPLVAVVPIHHPLTQKDTLSIYDLVPESLIFSRPFTCTQSVLNGYLERFNIVVNDSLIIDSRQEICEAVAFDLGIGFAFENDIHLDSRICVKPITEFDENVEEHIAWLKSRSFLPAVKYFVELALEMRSEKESAQFHCASVSD